MQLRAALLAAVAGQDLDEGDDGVFRIARRVAPDRIISTADPEARHGRKTAARGFDGYKGHLSIDPDSELVTATTVTAGNTGDASVACELLSDELAAGRDDAPAGGQPAPAAEEGLLSVYGDAAYGAGEFLADLQAAGARSMCKVQPPTAAGGRFTKDAFGIDLTARTVTCPAGQIAPLRRAPWPTSARPARPVRWPPSAPPPGAGAPSTPGPMKSSSRPAGPVSVTRTGVRTTGRPGPRSNARSGT